MLFAIVTIGSWLMTTCAIFIYLNLSHSGKPAGYGRYSDPSSPRTLPSALAWSIQESPAFFIPFYFYWTAQIGTEFGELLTRLLLIHYGYRTFVYPFFRKSGSGVPVEIVAFSFVFCVWNGVIQGVWNAYFQPEYPQFRPQFLIYLGVGLFFTGLVCHVISDLQLFYLRSYSNPPTYSIPRGLLFEFISCPNYFGECLEWIGYALAARSFPAIAFALFTVCNLAPRAISHHEWYLERFGDKYPKDRKALVPVLL